MTASTSHSDWSTGTLLTTAQSVMRIVAAAAGAECRRSFFLRGSLPGEVLRAVKNILSGPESNLPFHRCPYGFGQRVSAQGCEKSQRWQAKRRLTNDLMVGLKTKAYFSYALAISK